MLSDGTRSGQESLGVSGGLEPLPVSLSWAGGSVGILRAVVQIPMLAMFHARSVATYADGHADITVTGERGTLTLQVYSHDPLIAIEDPQQGRLRGKALASLIGNGNLRGWCVEKKSTTPSEDTVVWFPPGRQAPGNGY